MQIKKATKHHRYTHIQERFWSQVQKSDGCWLWVGLRDKDGYGRIRIDGKQAKAHRYSYQIHHGVIPNGMMILHDCDTPSCVNPAHLVAGTAKDNSEDRDTKGRGATGNKNGSRLHPEKRIRGNSHWWAKGQSQHPQGAKNGRAKLTDEQVREIRTLINQGGQTQRAIGAKYGVSDVIVGKIAKRQLWSHVED